MSIGHEIPNQLTRNTVACSTYICQAFTYLELLVNLGTVNMSADVVNHGEDRVPGEMIPLVFEEEGHVEGRGEAEIAGIGQVPGIV